MGHLQSFPKGLEKMSPPLTFVAELADAQASGACDSNIVWVRTPSDVRSQTSYSFSTDSKLCRKGRTNGRWRKHRPRILLTTEYSLCWQGHSCKSVLTDKVTLEKLTATFLWQCSISCFRIFSECYETSNEQHWKDTNGSHDGNHRIRTLQRYCSLNLG